VGKWKRRLFSSFSTASLWETRADVDCGACCIWTLNPPFFARCGGRPLVAPLQPGRIPVAVQWSPTSREKRARYEAHPGFVVGQSQNALLHRRTNVRVTHLHWPMADALGLQSQNIERRRCGTLRLVIPDLSSRSATHGRATAQFRSSRPSNKISTGPESLP
jgi:hypothetical protein